MTINQMTTALFCCLVGCFSDAVAEELTFEVRETAGIRRRSDVVSGHLTFAAPVASTAGFRISHNGETVRAQVLPTTDRSGTNAITFDFIANFDPFETRRYQLEYGVGVDAGAGISRGLKLVETPDGFSIANRDLIVWDVRKDLAGLYRFQRRPDVQYVQRESAGLVFRTRDGTTHKLSDRPPTTVRVTRQGPISCALQFVWDDWPQGARSVVDIEFFVTKSWARTRWLISGRKDLAAIGAELRLVLEGDEKLLDFGSGDFVYATLRDGQQAVLRAGPSNGLWDWAVLHGKAGTLAPMVESQGARQSPGGWVHVIDAERCTAAAVKDFGSLTSDRIEVGADGRMLFLRRQGQTLEFWVHFVTVPVHIGARTSPQSMRSPLEVHWVD